jgi:hypothetical protein
MGSANLFHSLEDRKMAQTQQHTSFAVLKLSQAVRQCFIGAQCERGETVCVSGQATKTGVSFDAPRAKVKVLL